MSATQTQQPEALNLEEFRAKVTRAAREPLLVRIAELEEQISAIGAGGVEPLRKQAVPVQMPEPDAWRYTTVRGHFRYRGRRVGFAAEYPMLKPEPLYTEQQVRAMLSTGVQAQAVPIGWREQFATEVYADLEAADNQDVPLEEYPAHILKVLDSTVGPRHPVVIKWRNDAIEQCIAIALKYCRDPESHKYLKQDLEAMPASAPAHPAEGVPAQTDHATEFAPPNSLPTFDECVLRVENSNFLEKRAAGGGYGSEHDSKTASQLHRFIYEYDDADPVRSSWFLHRLELLLNEVRSATHPTQQGMDAQTIKRISALSELVRMPNAEHFADAHNAAVRHLRALAAQAKQGGAS